MAGPGAARNALTMLDVPDRPGRVPGPRGQGELALG